MDGRGWLVYIVYISNNSLIISNYQTGPRTTGCVSCKSSCKRRTPLLAATSIFLYLLALLVQLTNLANRLAARMVSHGITLNVVPFDVHPKHGEHGNPHQRKCIWRRLPEMKYNLASVVMSHVMSPAQTWLPKRQRIPGMHWCNSWRHHGQFMTISTLSKPPAQQLPATHQADIKPIFVVRRFCCRSSWLPLLSHTCFGCMILSFTCFTQPKASGDKMWWVVKAAADSWG